MCIKSDCLWKLPDFFPYKRLHPDQRVIALNGYCRICYWSSHFNCQYRYKNGRLSYSCMVTELAPQHTYLYHPCSVDSTRLSFWVMWCTVIVPSGGPAGKLPGAPTCVGRRDYTGMISNMVFRNSGSHTGKHFYENYPQLLHAPLKMFVTTVIGRKSLKSIGFNGRQIISLHGVPPFLAPTMCAVNGFLNLFNRFFASEVSLKFIF